MRQVAMFAITERALSKQELIIESYTTLLMEETFKQINASKEHEVWNSFSWLCSRLAYRIRRMQIDDYPTTLDKINRRIERKTALEAFMTPMLDDNNPSFQKMTLAEVESTTALLLIAGSETMTTKLSETINFLVQNPVELRRLEREIRGILKVAPEGGDRICGHYLPVGTHVTINPVAMAYSEEYFHRHEQFLPRRFLSNDFRPTEFKKGSPNALKPFGTGTRSCLGKSLAMCELRLLLAQMI
ncbi:uncharacterized protein EAE98_005090 [Botrytis deweyae]|uniref:Cytochrome P450 n=1 Tax=Botrytis deweyae TaxID=2478750 RepID=A0ABQ7IQ77_9HELO|nr:uncharacterized protein EAE98_005090 [Botrytis deweyae]KAF7930690.1 hypothetical protein EAE98_005090 [Botrytis deweyae]